jgi:cysteine-rich repeat protein
MRATYVVVCLFSALAGLAACGDNLQGNREPVASDSNVTTPEDTPVSITVNVTDPDGAGLTFAFSTPEHGTITAEGGTVTYRPDDDYNGPDSIHVDISDGTYDVSAEINITVAPVNDGPVAVDDAIAAIEDTAATVTGAALVANDTDIEDDALTVTAVGTPSTGTVGMVGDTITYTPPANFTGPATFEYTVSDGAETDTGVVTVTVGGVNDPPVAVADALTTAEDTAGTITVATLVANDTDPEAQTLSVTGVSNFANGTAALAGGTVTFTPAANYAGAAAGFDYTVSDGAATATGHVTVTVTPVNDTPVANAQSVTVAEDGNVTITLTGSDIENTNLTFAIATQPATGSLGTITPVDATSATVVYTAGANSVAADSFTFTVTDTDAATSTAATVSITVTPQNDPPVANAATAMVDEDGSVIITLSGSDIDGDSLTFETVTGPATGTLSTYTLVPPAMATVTYTPNPNSAANDSFTFRVNDGTVNSAAATVTITVTGQQDPPVASATSQTTAEDTAVDITVTGTDLDGDALTFATGTGPDHGTLGAYTQLTPTSARVTYTPAANYNGPDAFTFTVNDGTATSAAATVSITVDAVNDAPVAVNDSDDAAQDVPMVRDASEYTANDIDVDGPALSVIAVGNPLNGTVDLAGTTITFTPDTGYLGLASFEYTVTDGTTPDVGVVTVNVSTNTPPVAVDDDATVAEDTDLVIATSTLLADDIDPDPQTLVINAVGGAVNGSVALAGGNVTFTPTANFSGPASFTYTVFDGIASDTGLVTVTVTPVNDLPVANADSFTVDEDSGATELDVLANDTDVEGPLTITSAIVVGAGSVTFTPASISFTPAANFAGPATVMYTVEDSDGAPANATVTITVTAINDLPVATNDAFTVDEDSATAPLDVLANDTDVEAALSITSVTQPSGGTVTFTATNVSFTPAPNFNGTTTFTYTVTDSDAATANATVTMTVTAINDAPVANNVARTTNEATTTTITLTATDVDSPSVTFAIATTPTSGTLGAVTSTGNFTATITYTPTGTFFGSDSFTFTATDGDLTSAPATASLTVTNVIRCGDGVIEGTEVCDDQNNVNLDGCTSACLFEDGWVCAGAPSACDEVCGDPFVVGAEECDDNNGVETDGCTTSCELAPVCNDVALVGGDRFAVDTATGHCYVSFDDDMTTFADAQAACVAAAGHLVSITSLGEQGLVASVHNTLQNPWIGLTDALVEGSFGWITGEAVSFNGFATGQPDGGDPEDCANLASEVLAPAGETSRWNDTSCTFTGFVQGRICELEPPCGNGIPEAGLGEACDDGNNDNFDGCDATCQSETLFFSEYVEGSSNNKAIEIANPSLAPRDLTGCTVRLYTNGSGTAGTTLPLTQTIPAQDVLVLCHASASAAVLSQCDVVIPTSPANQLVVNYNGDDAVDLVCNTVTVDVIGQIGFRPTNEWGVGLTSTADNTIRRKCGVTSGDPVGNDAFDPGDEWGGFAIDTFAGLGTYQCYP